MPTISRDGPRFADRFTGRAGDYSRYRPGYPIEIIDRLRAEIGLESSWIVADIGSGTGILSEIFLRNGNTVFCVEPNEDMKSSGEKRLRRYRSRFVSVDGSSEATGLRAKSVDLIIAGQALHWFAPAASRTEFKRILRKGGHVAIVYNHRKEDQLGLAYEGIIDRYRGDMPPIPDVDRAYVAKFLGDRKVRRFVIPNSQTLRLGGLLGRIASASYIPHRDSQVWKDIEADVRGILTKYGTAGAVRLRYDTDVYLGKFPS